MSDSSQEKDTRNGLRTSGPHREKEEKRKPLRVVVTEIDQEILRLLARRRNLLEKMKRNGRLDSGEEKFIRETWQNSVAKMSRDPQLSGKFFSMMQELTFLPRPMEYAEGGAVHGEQRRQAFNLAPPRDPVNIDITGPADSRTTRAWLYLAAASGKKCHLRPVLQNDMEIDFANALNRLGSDIDHENDWIDIYGGQPLERADTAIYVGNDEFNFYLLLAHYLGRPSRARFDGDRALKLADFSFLRQALPALGARITHIVPRNSGLPCRVECSGMLPESFTLAANMPAAFGEALILAASFYEAPFAVDLSAHPQKREILARIMPILENCGANFVFDGDAINMQPASLAISDSPALPISPGLGLFLMALVLPLTGKVVLNGVWPGWPDVQDRVNSLAGAGVACGQDSSSIFLEEKITPERFEIEKTPSQNVAEWHIPLLAAIAACVGLKEGTAGLPSELSDSPDVRDFFRACGLAMNSFGYLEKAQAKGGNPVWNAPSPWWAMALAVAACARSGQSGFQLGNPGIMTQIWPRFWQLYNNLPNPEMKAPRPDVEEGGKRRRILTNVVAVPPEIREEDWEK